MLWIRIYAGTPIHGCTYDDEHGRNRSIDNATSCDRIFVTIWMFRYIRGHVYPIQNFLITYSRHVASKDASASKWRSHSSNRARDVALQTS